MLKPLIVDHNKWWKIPKEMAVPDHLTCLLRNLYAGQEATESDMEQWTGSKLGKEYIKAVYCHPACLTFMKSTSGFPGGSEGKESACNLGDVGSIPGSETDLLEKNMATHCSILAWRISWTV